MSKPIVLTLLSRPYCHLCHDMEAALQPLLCAFEVELDIVDVDLDPDLEAGYGERVPVLLHADRELCHYFLDGARVRDYLSEIR